VITIGTVFGSTVDADNDGGASCGLSALSPDVWYAYTNTAACDVQVTASTCNPGTNFDTVVSVLDACGGSQIACNDDSNCSEFNGRPSTVTWYVPAGATHFIRVAGFDGETGDFELSVSRSSSNGSCSSAAPIEDGAWEGSTLCLPTDGQSLCEVASGLRIVEPPVSVVASSEYSGEYAVTKLFDATVTAADLNVTSYGFADGQFAVYGPLDGADAELYMDFGETITAWGVAYSQRQGDDPSLDKVGSMRLWFSDTDFGATLPATPADAELAITNTTDTTLTTYVFAGGARTGRFVAVQLIGASEFFPGNIGGSELRLWGLPEAAPTAWYAYTNTTSGDLVVRASTCDVMTDFDTVLSVVEACGGSEAACNDDDCASNTGASTLEWIVPAGATHYLRVSGQGGASGDFGLHVSSVAANDECAAATAIGEVDDYIFQTSRATTDGPDEPALCTASDETNIRADIWFDYTASCTGHAVVSLCDSEFDTRVAVYDGGACPKGPNSAVACNDDACGAYGSVVTFTTTAGESHLLRVGGSGAEQGLGRMSVQCFGPGDHDENGTVDLVDHLWLTECLLGPEATPNPFIAGASTTSCLAAFDLDSDGDVDLHDANAFVNLIAP